MISKTKQPSYYGCIMIKSLTAKINADVSLTSTFCVIKTGKMIFNYILVLGINKTNAKTIAIVLALIKKIILTPSFVQALCLWFRAKT
jgi:hypothetical protein